MRHEVYIASRKIRLHPAHINHPSLAAIMRASTTFSHLTFSNVKGSYSPRVPYPMITHINLQLVLATSPTSVSKHTTYHL